MAFNDWRAYTSNESVVITKDSTSQAGSQYSVHMVVPQPDVAMVTCGLQLPHGFTQGVAAVRLKYTSVAGSRGYAGMFCMSSADDITVNGQCYAAILDYQGTNDRTIKLVKYTNGLTNACTVLWQSGPDQFAIDDIKELALEWYPRYIGYGGVRLRVLLWTGPGPTDFTLLKEHIDTDNPLYAAVNEGFFVGSDSGHVESYIGRAVLTEQVFTADSVDIELQTNLRAHYRFNGPDATDSSVFQTPIILVSAPQLCNGHVTKYGMELNGTTQCILSSSANFGMDDIKFGMLGWIRAMEISGIHTIVCRGAGGLTSDEYRLYLDSTLQFMVGNGTTYEVVDSEFMLDTLQWVMLYAFHDPFQNQIGISVNGAAVTTFPYAGGCTDRGSPFAIGRRGGSASEYFHIQVNSWNFFKGRILNDAELAYMWNSGKGRDFPI